MPFFLTIQPLKANMMLRAKHVNFSWVYLHRR